MAAYNTSSAYDLSSFERAAKPQEQPAPLRLVTTSGVKNKGVVASLLNVRSVATFFLVVMVMCLVVYNQTCLHEATGEINQLAADIEELKSENTRLAGMIENKMSLTSVAEKAQEMGMHKLDKYQIEYVSLYRENKIAVVESAVEPNMGERVKMAVGTAFRHLKEYLGAV